MRSESLKSEEFFGSGFARIRAFLRFAVALAATSTRTEFLGVRGFVRLPRRTRRCNRRMLDMFHRMTARGTRGNGVIFKIEVTFKHAVHSAGTWCHHFQMAGMKPLKRRSGNQHVQEKTEHYLRSAHPRNSFVVRWPGEGGKRLAEWFTNGSEAIALDHPAACRNVRKELLW